MHVNGKQLKGEIKVIKQGKPVNMQEAIQLQKCTTRSEEPVFSCRIPQTALLEHFCFGPQVESP